MELTGVAGREPERIDESEPLEPDGGGDGGGERFDKEFAGVGGTIWKRPTDSDKTTTITTRSSSSPVRCASERPTMVGLLVVTRSDGVELVEVNTLTGSIAATG